MRKIPQFTSLFFFFVLLSITTFAQQKIKGIVTSKATGSGIPAVSA